MVKVSRMSIIVIMAVISIGIAQGDFNLTIFHVNDIHVRFEETDTYSGTCKKDEIPGQECFGGLPRLHHAVKTLQIEELNSIFLNGGDFYQGNAWYTLLKWTVIAPFTNILKFTAMTPGNHEFDDGNSGYIPFLKNISVPVLCANLDYSRVPEMKDLIKPSMVVVVGGKKIGIVGYLTPETEILSNPENLVFNDEVESIRAEALKLKNGGVDIIIALGHSGYEMDLKIAKEVEDIDVVVGGHSHSFLFTGNPPSTEIPVGEYPTIVRRENGQIVPVVQAYAYTKYLGHLQVNFDDNGIVKSYKGAPILLDKSHPEDKEMLELLQPWKEQIKNLTSAVIGETKVLLSPSRNQEANIGNFITDSMVDWFVNHPASDGQTTLNTRAGFISSGGIRGALNVGNITLNDLLTVLPFANTIDLVTLDGSTIREAFEFSASKLNPDGSGVSGAFLQVSGFKLVIDVTKPTGSRISSLLIRKGSSRPFPAYEPVEDSVLYNIIVTNFLADGGDGFSMIAENKKRQIAGTEDVLGFQEYLKKMSPVDQGIENRIDIVIHSTTTKAPSTETTPGSSTNLVSSFSSTFVMLIFVKFILD